MKKNIRNIISRAWLACLATFAIAGTATAVHAQSGVYVPKINRNDKVQVVNAWNWYKHRINTISAEGAVTTFDNISTGFTGNVNNCVAGSINPEWRIASIRQVNWFRSMVGLPSVSIGPAEDNSKAQAAALMMRAGLNFGMGQTHSPGTSYPCYTVDGAVAASKSLLALSGDRHFAGPKAIDAHISDADGGDGRNSAVGHRRWVLSPYQTHFGYGEVFQERFDPSQGKNVNVAEGSLYFSGSVMPGVRAAPAYVAWPPAGFVPYEAMPNSNYWSLGCAGCDFTGATVEMKLNGQVLPVAIRPYDGAYVDPTLVWSPPDREYWTYSQERKPFGVDDVYEVKVTYTQNMLPRTSTYKTTVFNPYPLLATLQPYELTDMWWNAGESGWGLQINQAPTGNLFIAWYLYDAQGRQRFLTIPGGTWTSPNTFTGQLWESSGPVYYAEPFNPDLVTRKIVGNVELRVNSADNIVMSYTLDGQPGTKVITRFKDIPKTFTTDAANYAGLWWKPDESGWGISIAHQYDLIFLVWYTYDEAGLPIYIILSGGTWEGKTYTGDLYRSTSAPWTNGAFNPNLVGRPMVGRGSVTFTDDDKGVFTYTVNGKSGSKPIKRMEFWIE